MTETVVIIDMTLDEAEKAVVSINNHSDELQKKILSFYERKGHKALGYDSFRECAMDRFTLGQTMVYYHLNAVQIKSGIAALPDTEPDFSTIVKELPESLFRPLKSLGDGSALEQRAALQLAFAAAKECIANQQPTAALIEESAAVIASLKDGKGEINYDGEMMAATSLVIHAWTERQRAAIERRENAQKKLDNPPTEGQQIITELLERCGVRIVSVAGKQVTFLLEDASAVKKLAQLWRDNPTNLKLDLYSE